MHSESPYYVTTNSGKLELTKGAYLTLMKRKSSICKTMQKSRGMNRSYKQNKKTIKKNYTEWKQRIYSINDETIMMSASRRGFDKARSFKVKPDRQVFNFSIMIPNVPVIEIQCDNDCDSEWPEIDDCVNNMRMSLSLAAFDRSTRLNM